ncbi:4-hydroxybenzoate octaprenyltransferase [Parvularcula marina]|uniref:4-hydroxybenzoate octaprenyltransferase n=1 Tax=Parvularcula marina TaxID=2292771 RepID=UPI0035132C41
MSETETKTPDAVPTFVDRLPGPIQPYLRLMRADRPVGVWLLLIPCLWGSLVARPHPTPAPEIFGFWFLFLIGSFVMRSAGCIYNDIIDRDIDRQVERTAARPLASGRIKPAAAWVLLVFLCLIGLAVLLQLGLPAIITGLCSLILVAGYPFMKRITWWPQAWLGLTFNWGVLVGAATLAGTIPVSAMMIYAAGIFWTLGYDTIYAHQDREDDALVGVKSSARRLGQHSATAIAAFFGLTLVLFAFALIAEDALHGLPFLLPAAIHFIWQIRKLDIEDPALCLKLFKSNVLTGILLTLPLFAA